MELTNIESLGLQGITGGFVGADDEYIVTLESLAGFRLPDGYREFLKKRGASLFSEDMAFRPLVPSPWAVNGMESFDLFYGMSEDPGFDVSRVNIRLQGAIPERTIAIGHDPGSNHVVLDASGAIYFFDRDSARVFLCAKSFEEFLASFGPRRTS